MSIYAKDYGYFFDSNSHDRTYNAESFEEWLKPFFTTGVLDGELEVLANDDPDMTVNVAPGRANLNGKAAYWPMTNTLTLTMASGVYNRIDTVVLRRDNTNRTISIELITGTAGLNPQPTPPTRSNDIYELVLAQILVRTGTTIIENMDITDTRMDPDLCGWVASTVDEISFDQVKVQFDDWFEHVKGQLDEDAAGHLQNEIDALDAAKAENTDLEAVKADIGIVENTNTAMHNISNGQYVIWKGNLYKATANISIGATLSTGNLSAVSNGIGSVVKSLSDTIAGAVTYGTSGNWKYWKFASGLFVAYEIYDFSGSITAAGGGMLTEGISLPFAAQSGSNYLVLASLNGYVMASGSATLFVPSYSYNTFSLRIITTAAMATPSVKVLVVGKWN